MDEQDLKDAVDDELGKWEDEGDEPEDDGTEDDLTGFVREALLETDTLRENGAQQAAAARLALLRKLVAGAAAHLDADIDIREAAREKGAL